jgi:integrase
MKLGTFPDIGIAEARQKARTPGVVVSEGNDPAADRRADQASLRVRDLVENYISQRAVGQRSGKEIARRLRKNVTGVIGDIKLSHLHRRDLAGCIHRIKGRGAMIEANRVFEDVRAMVRWARAEGYLDENYVEGMPRPSDPVARDRVLAADEIRAFWSKLASAPMQEGTRRILRLCLITAARVGEVAGMRSEEIDLEAQVWTIPAARSKNKQAHALPISDFAVLVIKEQLADTKEAATRREGRLATRIARLPGRHESAEDAPTDMTRPWLFPGPGARKPVTAPAVAKAVMRARAAAITRRAASPSRSCATPWSRPSSGSARTRRRNRYFDLT